MPDAMARANTVRPGQNSATRPNATASTARTTITVRTVLSPSTNGSVAGSSSSGDERFVAMTHLLWLVGWLGREPPERIVRQQARPRMGLGALRTVPGLSPP